MTQRKARELDLGMDRPIPRRDLLHGMSAVVGGPIAPRRAFSQAPATGRSKQHPGEGPVAGGQARRNEFPAGARAYLYCAIDRAHRAVEALDS